MKVVSRIIWIGHSDERFDQQVIKSLIPRLLYMEKILKLRSHDSLPKVLVIVKRRWKLHNYNVVKTKMRAT